VNAPRPRPSRAPVYVTVAGFAIAIGLVLFALRGFPAPEVRIDRAGTADSPREVTVIMRDHRFQPEPLTLIRGERVRFTIFNGGLEPHEFVLGDDTVQRAWAEADAAATPPLPFTTAPPASVPPGTGGVRLSLGSGGEGTVDFQVPRSGGLSLVCHLPGHVEKGMVAEVDFTVPAAPDVIETPAVTGG